MLLKDFMGEALADWERDLSAPWRGFLDPVALDFEAMGGTLRIDDPSLLRPQRKRPGHRAGDPHIFRAFNHIEPERVRVLVIGQDPYPSPGQATGRAFEDGLFDAWDGSVSA
ncbi:MAG TPA: hypothetical protein VFR28_10960, partial [Allosphingosinicella sp.]|nr:hypothetical protein [Allosphingosinicella sp.]